MKMFKYLFSGFALLLLIASCTKNQEIPFNEIFELKEGKTATIEDGDFIIDFVKVVEDSRCPINAACIVAGKVIVEFQVQFSTDLVDVFTLSLDPDQTELNAKILGNFEITLLEVNPYPGELLPTNNTVKLKVEEL